MRFRPCIDLHGGKVKQIVGSTLHDEDPNNLKTNYASSHPSSYYSKLYQQDKLTGGHIIMLGPGNQDAALEALHAWPGGMQLGGGINSDNAKYWLDNGASHVIVTSYVFHDGQINYDRLKALEETIGRKRLVLDLSCRWRDDSYYVVTDRWQKFTQLQVNEKTLDHLSTYCDEFLVHAVDVEGKCMGIDQRLIELLASCAQVPVTYAGGVASMADLELIRLVGQGVLDATVGSALDIFGGSGLAYKEVVQFHQRAV